MMGQRDHFIFIQETGRQAFYVRIGDGSHSSSASGHIILSLLKDSVYNLFIGFPKSRYPEQVFNVSVNKKDRGFELRIVNGKWQLSDIQGLQVIHPVAVSDKNAESTKKRTLIRNLWPEWWMTVQCYTPPCLKKKLLIRNQQR